MQLAYPIVIDSFLTPIAHNVHYPLKQLPGMDILSSSQQIDPIFENHFQVVATSVLELAQGKGRWGRGSLDGLIVDVTELRTGRHEFPRANTLLQVDIVILVNRGERSRQTVILPGHVELFAIFYFLIFPYFLCRSFPS